MPSKPMASMAPWLSASSLPRSLPSSAMLVTRPYSNDELRRLLEDLAARHFPPGDSSVDRGLVAEAARRLSASAASDSVFLAAYAIAGHFCELERERGDYADVFREPATGQTLTNSVSIPVPMLRALVAVVGRATLESKGNE